MKNTLLLIKMKRVFLSSLFLSVIATNAISGIFNPQPASAALARLLGWKYSDNETYRKIEGYFDIAGKYCGIFPIPERGCTIFNTLIVIVDIIDPPETRILSGRVTVDYDPSYQLIASGWYGEFGADPLLPAPPIDGSSFDENLLQFEANPVMQSSSIDDSSPGTVVFEFDWGVDGFLPTLNQDENGHFNILGMYFLPSFDVSPSLIGTAPKTFVSSVIGSLEDVVTNGTNASSYLQCSIPSEDGGPDVISYCGETVPEPTSILSLLALGTFGTASTLKRKLKSSKSTEKGRCTIRNDEISK